jgi:hypothetical protein
MARCCALSLQVKCHVIRSPRFPTALGVSSGPPRPRRPFKPFVMSFRLFLAQRHRRHAACSGSVSPLTCAEGSSCQRLLIRTRPSDLGRVGDAVPVAVLAHGVACGVNDSHSGVGIIPGNNDDFHKTLRCATVDG